MHSAEGTTNFALPIIPFQKQTVKIFAQTAFSPGTKFVFSSYLGRGRRGRRPLSRRPRKTGMTTKRRSPWELSSLTGISRSSAPCTGTAVPRRRRAPAAGEADPQSCPQPLEAASAASVSSFTVFRHFRFRLWTWWRRR